MKLGKTLNIKKKKKEKEKMTTSVKKRGAKSQVKRKISIYQNPIRLE